MAAGVTDRPCEVNDLVALWEAYEQRRAERLAQMQDMRGRWMQLAEMASTEQDPVKLLKLITEINQLLMQKEERLVNALDATKPKNSK